MEQQGVRSATLRELTLLENVNKGSKRWSSQDAYRLGLWSKGQLEKSLHPQQVKAA